MLLNTAKNLISLIRSEKQSQLTRNCRRQHSLELLIKHASKSIPMYQDLYAAINTDEPFELDQLESLPLVSKKLLKVNFPDRCTDPGVEKDSLYQIATSGTSDRVMLFQDEFKRDWDRAADLLLKFRTEGYGKVLTIPPDDCYERCGLNDQQQTTLYTSLMDTMAENGRKKQEAKQKFVARLASQLMWREHLAKPPGVEGTAVPQDFLNSYFDHIEELSPVTVRGFPYYFWMMACRSNGRTFATTKYVRPSGGKATPFMIEKIEQNLGVKFRENYGTAELGTIAMDSDDSRQQILIEELFIVEFLRDGTAVKDGEIGELVVTDLKNQVAPLIRYRVGDVGRVVKTPATVDEQGQFRFEVCGRLDETVVTSSGKVLTPDTLTDFFLRQGMNFSKLIQKSDRQFVLEVVPDTPIPKNLEFDFSQLIGEEVSLILRQVRRIAPEGSGKYKLVVSTSYHNFNKTENNVTTTPIS